MENEITEVILISLGASLIFMLIIRELVCWYYKINEMVTMIKSIEQSLSSLDKKIPVIQLKTDSNRDKWIHDSIAKNKHIKL